MPTRPTTHRAQPDSLARAARRDRNRRRGSAASRGYDRRWQAQALAFRRQYPFCADPFGVHAADGRYVPGEHVDHIVPRRAGGSDAWGNLQTLCPSCHSRKTVLYDGGLGRVVGGGGGGE